MRAITKFSRKTRNAYIVGRRSVKRQRGTCEWIMFTERWPRLTRKLPKKVRYRIIWSWPVQMVIWCNEKATVTAEAVYSGYNGLHVCESHAKDVELANWIDEARRSGELDRLMNKAETPEQSFCNDDPPMWEQFIDGEAGPVQPE